MKNTAIIAKFIFIFLLTAYASLTKAINVICDLGGVLIETKYVRTIVAIGIEKFAYYASTWQNPFACHKILYNFLESIKPHDHCEPLTYDAHGLIIPQLMCDWLKGLLSSKELLTIIDATPGIFKSRPQELIVRALAHTIFNPTTFMNTRLIVPEGIEFLAHCKKEGHKIYALSNWDFESFALLQNQHSDFFKLFDGIVISGTIGLLKPDTSIYQYLLDQFNLNAHECFFIDDQPENVTAAHYIGMPSMQYRKKYGIFRSHSNFDSIKTKIKKLSN